MNNQDFLKKLTLEEKLLLLSDSDKVFLLKVIEKRIENAKQKAARKKQ